MPLNLVPARSKYVTAGAGGLRDPRAGLVNPQGELYDRLLRLYHMVALGQWSWWRRGWYVRKYRYHIRNPFPVRVLWFVRRQAKYA